MSMMNTGDILETIEMFTQDNLDVRTVTMGISLLDCIDPDPKKACEKVYNKITTKAANLVPTVEHISAEYGIPIINKRISVTPIAMLLGACPDADPVDFAKALDAAGKKVGVNFVGGYTALVHKGFSAGSYKDMTRVAWLNAPMWAELFLENRDCLLRELGWLMESLREYRAALEKNDLPELTRLLEDNSIEDIPVRMVRDTGMLRRWQVRAPWKLGGQYTLTIPEGAITDVAGLSNDSIIRKYTVLDPEKFATVLIHVRGRDDGTKYIVQLLDGSNALKQEKRDVTTGDIRFNYVPAGEIKFREQPQQN